MSKPKRWVITVSMSNQWSLSDVSEEVTKTGFDVDQVLTEIWCITGAASDDVAKKVRSVPGVTDVSLEGSIKIGPPDTEITW